MGENGSLMNSWRRARQVFLRWERLRIPYNALLVAVVLVPTAVGSAGLTGRLPDPADGRSAGEPLLPAARWRDLLAWLGLRSKWVTRPLCRRRAGVDPCIYFFASALR